MRRIPSLYYICKKGLFCIAFSMSVALFAQAAGTVSGTMDWVAMDINTNIRLSLKSLGVSLPAGRSIAEESLFAEYYARLHPFLYTIPVDSSSVLGDFVEQGRLSPAVIDNIIFQTNTVPPSISNDMQNITASYRIDLNEVSSILMRHETPALMLPVIDPLPVPSYTGILIIADGKLPVHGRAADAYLAPCLFPKIWDTQMNLIFDKKFMDMSMIPATTVGYYMNGEHILKRTASGLSPEIEKIIGGKPLRILARGVYGVTPTDPVIDSEDARLILSSEKNRRLLREGRVVIIAPANALKKEITGVLSAQTSQK